MIHDRIELVETKKAVVFDERKPLRLECGDVLPRVEVAYETYGELNSSCTNAILVCHALTANAHAAGFHAASDTTPGWWDGLIGPGKVFDTERYFVVCPNILGSCYGTTGPTSTNPATGRPYRNTFPAITVRDIVTVQRELLRQLGVNRLVCVAGSSLGGMQALEWGIMFPEMCETIVPISTAAQQPAWCIGFNAAARAAIMNDPQWNGGEYQTQPARGLALARMIGMLTYRSPVSFDQRFGRSPAQDRGGKIAAAHSFSVEQYLHYQGDKLVKRFDANTYVCLSRAMDSHDAAAQRGSVEEALRSIRARTLSIGVSTDLRYPTHYQRELATLVPNASYVEIESVHGHDAFLIEFDALNRIIGEFLERR
jgi:homoserine O-acetyltransferase